MSPLTNTLVFRHPGRHGSLRPVGTQVRDARLGLGLAQVTPRAAQRLVRKNDLYAVVFAGVAILLIALGTAGYHPLEWIGAGMTAYGFLFRRS